ncbi:hypothetical protein PAEPH01_2461 [Pancytospora epiphaga]|nr:hypothetical protein PAEPH01_2461 [Pancytospora epiphaga]
MSDKTLTLKRSRVSSSSDTTKKYCSTTNSCVIKRVRTEEKEEGPPLKLSKCPSHLKPFLKRRRQCEFPSVFFFDKAILLDGGGPKIQEFVKKDHFPTDEEKEFFFKHVELSRDLRLKRQNAAYSSLEPMRMKFVNLDQIIPGDVLYVHTANLIDIFIRMMIEKAGSSLKDTQYWLQ